jgi:hypothetical protein
MGRQTPQMTVEQKTWLDGTAILDGMNFDSISILRDPVWRNSLTIDLHPSNLRVWHSERLNQVLEALSFPELEGNLLSLLIPPQEIVQPVMEKKICCATQ